MTKTYAKETTRVNKVALATVLVLAFAVANGSAEPNQQPEGAIARPSSRAATAFVPRLGKRLDQTVNALERSLCADSQECSRLALLGALIKGLVVGDTTPNMLDQQQRLLDGGDSPMQAESPNMRQLVGDTDDNSPSLLELLFAQQQRAQKILPRRDTRGSTGELAQFSGTKRVVQAFTPRIGR